MTRRDKDRAAAVSRALEQHSYTGLIRGYRLHSGRASPWWQVQLTNGPDAMLPALPQAELFCAALASAAQAVSTGRTQFRVWQLRIHQDSLDQPQVWDLQPGRQTVIDFPVGAAATRIAAYEIANAAANAPDPGEVTYSLAEIRAGTGWPPTARFRLVQP